MTLPADERWARAATPGPWTERAACRGQGDLFFTPTGHELRADRNARIGQAEAICRACPVQADCLTFARTNHEIVGIWGGACFDPPRRLRLTTT